MSPIDTPLVTRIHRQIVSFRKTQNQPSLISTENIFIEPVCEQRTLPKSSSRANWAVQGLLGFYAEPTLRDVLVYRANAPLKAKKGQECLARAGLFGE
jgi:hypothetical protein